VTLRMSADIAKFLGCVRANPAWITRPVPGFIFVENVTSFGASIEERMWCWVWPIKEGAEKA